MDIENMPPSHVSDVRRKNEGLTSKSNGQIRKGLSVLSSQAPKPVAEAYQKPSALCVSHCENQSRKPSIIIRADDEIPHTQKPKTSERKPLCDISDVSIVDVASSQEEMEIDISALHDEIMSDESEDTDIDPIVDANIILIEPTYSTESMVYWLEMERRHLCNPKYMKKQRDIDYEMRATLVDWLVEVSEECKLHNETVHLAVNYIDRFLSVMTVQREKLQLVGVTAVFIASKYEEIYPPPASEFVYLTDDTYTVKQLFKMEVLMLKVLKFNVTVPSSNAFLSDLLGGYATVRPLTPHLQRRLQFLATYLCELTLLDGETFLPYLSSQVAASCYFVASAALCLEPWPKAMREKSGYEFADIEDCVRSVYKAFVQAPSLTWKASTEKYSNHKWESVALIEAPKTLHASM